MSGLNDPIDGLDRINYLAAGTLVDTVMSSAGFFSQPTTASTRAATIAKLNSFFISVVVEFVPSVDFLLHPQEAFPTPSIRCAGPPRTHRPVSIPFAGKRTLSLAAIY
jgi:hypothetical protein